MSREILIKSKDLDVGYLYTVFISTEQAENILAAAIGDEVSLGSEGCWAKIGTDTIMIRYGKSGPSSLSKTDVISQIYEQL